MKIRIEGDGKSPMTTRVVNAETGELIEGVMRVEIVLDPAQQWDDPKQYSAVITIYNPALDFTVDAEVKESGA